MTAPTLTSRQRLRRLALMALGSEELRHLADAAWLRERREHEQHIARLADVIWGPALGAYRKGRRPPAYPADAPSLPTRKGEP